MAFFFSVIKSVVAEFWVKWLYVGCSFMLQPIPSTTDFISLLTLIVFVSAGAAGKWCFACVIGSLSISVGRCTNDLLGNDLNPEREGRSFRTFFLCPVADVPMNKFLTSLPRVFYTCIGVQLFFLVKERWNLN